MGLQVNGIEQNYQYTLKGKQQPFLALTGGMHVAPTSNVNGPMGIAIPQNKGGYTTAEDGATSISTGQDGYGLAHRNPNEYNFHLIA